MKKDKIARLVCSGMWTDVRGNDVFVRDSAWCNLSLDSIRTLHVAEASVTVLVENNTLHTQRKKVVSAITNLRTNMPHLYFKVAMKTINKLHKLKKYTVILTAYY